MKKFSIITVCLNALGIERTCESIANQTFQDFEWIVIDGGSDTKTQNVFEKYKYRMDYFVSEKDSGVYDAMNKGIQLASGERLNFLNAGDWYVGQDVLSSVNSFARSFSEIDVLHGKIRTHHGILIFSTDNIEKNMWLIGSVIPHPAIFYKYDVFEIFGKYRTDYKIVSDYAFNMTLFFNNCSFKHIDCLVAHFAAPGLSTHDHPLHIAERGKIVEEFFTKEEILKIDEYKRLFGLMTRKRLLSDLRNKVKNTNIKDI